MKNRIKAFRTLNLGNTMVEAIAVIAVLIFLTPLIYTRAFEYAQELERGNVASKLRMLRHGVYSYMEMNYEDIASGGGSPAGIMIGGVHFYPMAANIEEDYIEIPITDTELSHYLNPSDYAKTKFWDKIRVSLKRKRAGEQIILNALIATDGVNAIPMKQGTSIAALVGAEGGYTSPLQGTSEFKATGVGGFFEIDLNEYFPGGVNMPKKGHLVVSTGYFPSQVPLGNLPEINYLFRMKALDFPGYDEAVAHMMETNIDFGKYGTDDEGNVVLEGGFDIVNRGDLFGDKFDYDNSGVTPNYFEIEFENKYGISADNNALLQDLRLSALGGAKISEALPNVVLMSIMQNVEYGFYIPTPGFEDHRIFRKSIGCPKGYTQMYTLVAKESPMVFETLVSSPSYYDGSLSTDDLTLSYLIGTHIRKSQNKISSDTMIYKTYFDNGDTLAECERKGNDGNNISCVLYELENENKIKVEECTFKGTTSSTTTHYNKSNGKVTAKFNTATSPFAMIFSPEGSTAPGNQDDAIVKCLGGSLGNSQCVCSRRGYCPGYTVGEWFEDKHTNELVQHGKCQAAINAIRNKIYVRTIGEWYPVNINGVASSLSQFQPPDTNLYINSRVQQRQLYAPETGTCPTGTTPLAQSNNYICKENNAPYRVFTVSPLKMDVYSYCSRQ